MQPLGVPVEWSDVRHGVDVNKFSASSPRVLRCKCAVMVDVAVGWACAWHFLERPVVVESLNRPPCSVSEGLWRVELRVELASFVVDEVPSANRGPLELLQVAATAAAGPRTTLQPLSPAFCI